MGSTSSLTAKCPLADVRLPHVALLALPGLRVLRRVGAETPDFADLVGDLLADEIGRPAVDRTVAGGIDHEVGGQLGPVIEHDAGLAQSLDLPAADEVDRAVDDEVAGADVDVVARAAAQVLGAGEGIRTLDPNLGKASFVKIAT
jgi:hypothetical protein